MSDTVIRVENLSKLYHLGELHKQTGSFRDMVTHSFSRLWTRNKSKYYKSNPDNKYPITNNQSNNQSPITDNCLPDSECIWSLKDVSFEVKRGEVLGIIGANGAGKSTLLKILACITKPTEGKVLISSQIGALLEVGMGFHPELTGKENIYLNGAILGMKKAEIDRKFDEIVDFSGVEKFIETPVKRYSSGMYVRLAFAVAAHMDSEVLLIDEVLAVGDMVFQKKCLKKMERFGQKGTTVVFVSHNLVAMQSLCPKTMVLDRGRLQFLGPTEEAVVYYQKYMAQQLMEVTSVAQQGNVRKKKSVEILQIDLFDENREPAITFKTGDVANIVLTVQFYETLDSLRFAVLIKKPDGSVIFDTDSRQLGLVCRRYSSGDYLKIEFKLKLNLLKGVYSINAHIRPHDFSCYYDYTETVCSFEVSEKYSWQGVAHLDPQVRILEADGYVM